MTEARPYASALWLITLLEGGLAMLMVAADGWVSVTLTALFFGAPALLYWGAERSSQRATGIVLLIVATALLLPMTVFVVPLLSVALAIVAVGVEAQAARREPQVPPSGDRRSRCPGCRSLIDPASQGVSGPLHFVVSRVEAAGEDARVLGLWLSGAFQPTEPVFPTGPRASGQPFRAALNDLGAGDAVLMPTGSSALPRPGCCLAQRAR